MDANGGPGRDEHRGDEASVECADAVAGHDSSQCRQHGASIRLEARLGDRERKEKGRNAGSCSEADGKGRNGSESSIGYGAQA
jgi:hypothetical protein